LEHGLERLRGATKEICSAEAAVAATRDEVRLEREEAVEAIVSQAPEQLGPPPCPFSRQHDPTVRTRVLDVNGAQPGP
jgi:hypothetical protein